MTTNKDVFGTFRLSMPGVYYVLHCRLSFNNWDLRGALVCQPEPHNILIGQCHYCGF